MTASAASIPEMLARNVAAVPRRTALSDGRRTVSYSTLDTVTTSVTATLAAHGVQHGDRVGLMGPRDARLLAAFYGILRFAACPLVIGTEWRREETLRRLRTIGATCVVSTTPAADLDPSLPMCTVDVDEAEPTGSASPNLPLVQPDQTAYVVFTSGSTGEPKVVEVTHASAVHYAVGLRDRLGMGWGRVPKLGHVTTLAADLGHTTWLLALATGGSVDVVEDDVARNPEAFWRRLAAADVSHVKTTPSHFAALLDGRPANAGQLDTLIFGGEKLPRSLAECVLRTGVARRVVNHYGPTETTIGATCFVANTVESLPAEEFSVPIGRPIGDARLTLIRDDGTVEDGYAAGELAIGGPGVAAGYLGRPEATARHFIDRDGDRLYLSRDLCRRTVHGDLVFESRLDDQVKINGHRIDPALIEAVLADGPGVRQAALVVRQTPSGPRLGAAVRFAGTAIGDRTGGLASYLRARLPAYAVPAPVIALDAFPVDGNGKVDRAQLAKTIDTAIGRLARTPATSRPDEAGAANATDIAAARLIAGRWAQLLGVSTVDIDANVLELGGDSILAMRTVVFLHGRNRSVTVDDVYRNPTARMLATAAARADREANLARRPFLTTRTPTLGPAQRWFFQQHVVDEDHWNQVVVLRCGQSVDPPSLVVAVRAVVKHHPVLRRPLSGDGPRDVPLAPDDLDPVSFSSLTQPGGDIADRVHAVGARVQLDLDLRAGRLLRVHLFRGHGRAEDRLVVVAHHLVVDTVSWRILLEDLAVAYRHALTGDPGALSPTRDYYHVIGVDTPAPEGGESSARHRGWGGGRDIAVAFALDAVATERLRARYPHPRQLEASMLTAFVDSVADDGHVVAEVETHGREKIDDADGLNTVGWFTAVRQITIASSGGDFHGRAARAADDLAAVPVLPMDAQRSGADVGFNFLGVMRLPKEPLLNWTAADETVGAARCGAVSNHIASATARIVEGRLSVDVVYDPRRFPRAAAVRGCSNFAKTLANIAAAPEIPEVMESEHSTVGYPFLTGRFTASPRIRVIRESPRVLLTGATGYLGRALLAELMTRRSQVTCLVRPGTEPGCDVRDGVRRGEFSVLAGDIVEDGLGLSDDATAEVRRSQLVLHAAADVRIVAPPDELHRTNVEGVGRLLDVLRGCDVTFHHVSSLAVAGHVTGAPRRFSEADLLIGQRFLAPYDRSKFEAEMAVRCWAAERGGSAFVYRTGHVAAHGTTGEFQHNMAHNRIYQTLRGYVLGGLAPSRPDAVFTFSHVDIVAKGVVTIALSSDAAPAVYHVESPYDVPHDAVVGWLNGCGYPVTLVEEDGFDRAVDGLTDAETRRAAILAASWARLDARGVRFERARTVRMLAAAGLRFPEPTKEWFHASMAWAAQSGFLPHPVSELEVQRP